MKIKVEISSEENRRILNISDSQVMSYDQEDYVATVVASEIGNAGIEACKAQAVAARTYAWRYCSSEKPISDLSSKAQSFRLSRYKNISFKNAQTATSATKGSLLTYQGSIIDTCPYSASNGGMIVSAEERWGSNRPWLLSYEDKWDYAATGGDKKGHGVGMSQKGAIYAAEHGRTYEEILSFYYPGCNIRIVEEKIMENSKTKAIKEWALERVGNPYVYGGTGKVCTVSYRNQQATQYPDSAEQIRKNCQRMSKGKGSCAGCEWYDEEKKQGKQCYDCAQFTRWGMKEAGITLPSGATSQWRKAEWSEKGTIETQPDCLCLVYRQDKDGTMGHTGIYLGDGTVVDARGTNYGVRHDSLKEYGRWTHWGIPAGQYETEVATTMIATVTGGDLNMRSAQSKGASRICQIPNGTEVGVIEKGDTWCKVEYGEHAGYVMTKYLAFAEALEPEGEYDVVIHCGSKEERDRLLEQLRGAEMK